MSGLTSRWRPTSRTTAGVPARSWRANDDVRFLLMGCEHPPRAFSVDVLQVELAGKRQRVVESSHPGEDGTASWSMRLSREPVNHSSPVPRCHARPRQERSGGVTRSRIPAADRDRPDLSAGRIWTWEVNERHMFFVRGEPDPSDRSKRREKSGGECGHLGRATPRPATCPSSRPTASLRDRGAQSDQLASSTSGLGVPPSAGHHASVPRMVLVSRATPSSTRTCAPSSAYASRSCTGRINGCGQDPATPPSSGTCAAARRPMACHQD